MVPDIRKLADYSTLSLLQELQRRFKELEANQVHRGALDEAIAAALDGVFLGEAETKKSNGIRDKVKPFEGE